MLRISGNKILEHVLELIEQHRDHRIGKMISKKKFVDVF